MKFALPWLLLLTMPVLAVWWIHARRSRDGIARKRFPIFVIAVLSLVLAASKPYWSFEPEKKVVRGADLVILLDVSQSMFCPVQGGLRRIDQARNFLRALLPQFAGSSVSVIYFAGDAQIGCPPTTDIAAVYLFLDSVAPAMTAQPGSNLAALQTTLAEYLTSVQNSQIQNKRQQLALLFSDGEFSSSPEAFGTFLRKQKDLLLLSFACGKGKAAVPKYDLSAPFPGAFSQVQPASLQTVANGGFYDLSQSHADMIGKEVAGNVLEIVSSGRPAPKYQTALFSALALFALLLYQAYPFFSRSNPSVAAGLYRVAILLILLSTVSMSSDEKNNLFSSAMQDMKSNKLEKALNKLKSLDAAGSSEEVDVAIGNVYYLQNNYEQAISFYQKALAGNAGNQEARWNWEVVLKRQKAPQNPPPPSPPRPRPAPSQLPREAEALLKYFDQQEKQQMQLTNTINAHTEKFAW